MRRLRLPPPVAQGFFGTLKQALASDAFSADFDRLREELSMRVADLQLYQLVAARVDIKRMEGTASLWASHRTCAA